MLEIFICEDDKTQRKRTEKIIENYIQRYELDMKLSLSTANPFQVLEYVKENKQHGLYFFDVDLSLKDIDGIRLAAQIREYDKSGEIVFITDHPEMMALTFEHHVKAMDYISKDNDDNYLKERIRHCIDQAKANLESEENNEIFRIIKGSRTLTEEYKNIMFFETISGEHKILLHAKNREVDFYGTLNEIVEMHPCLFRTKPSHVVNVQNILEIDSVNGLLKMRDGQPCEISKLKISALKKLLGIKKGRKME